MLRVSGHGDQYHHPLIMMISITPPDTCWSPHVTMCPLDGIMRGHLLSIQLFQLSATRD